MSGRAAAGTTDAEPAARFPAFALVPCYLSPVPKSVLVRCRRCGGEMNADGARCPWCGQQRRFQTLLPLTLLVCVGIGLMFASGLLRWEMVQETFAALFPKE